jgi:L-histidine N-alpha-methyltransferase
VVRGIVGIRDPSGEWEGCRNICGAAFAEMVNNPEEMQVYPAESASHHDGRVHIEPGRGIAFDAEAERAAVVADLLRPLPTINSKYFYDDRGSELFEEITRLPEYYQTRTEEALLEAIADDLVERTDVRELVELGSGAGRKIHLILDAIQRAGKLLGCTLLDINETFLTESAARLAGDYPSMAVRGIVGDFLHDIERVGPGDARLFIFLAGTIGNLHPLQTPRFLAQVRRALGPGDAFLVGLDLVKNERRLHAAYNDAAGITAQFNLNILRVLNRRFDLGFDVEAFDHVAFYDTHRAWIEMRLRARYDTEARLGYGNRLALAAGDEIRTEISCKYTRASFREIAQGTGLGVTHWYTDPERLFALALLEPDGARSDT